MRDKEKNDPFLSPIICNFVFPCSSKSNNSFHSFQFYIPCPWSQKLRAWCLFPHNSFKLSSQCVALSFEVLFYRDLLKNTRWSQWLYWKWSFPSCLSLISSRLWNGSKPISTFSRNERFYGVLKRPTWYLNFTEYGHVDCWDDFWMMFVRWGIYKQFSAWN